MIGFFILCQRGMITLSAVLCVAVFCAVGARAADWPQFRGPGGRGISDETGIPATWSQSENIVWKTPLPAPGNSSPIVSSGRVFLTCATESGKNRGLFCFDRTNGRELWSQMVRYEDEDPTHSTNPYAGSSPVADGERVIVWHGSAGLYAYDFEGRELWHRDLGRQRHIWGYGSSPVILGDAVILNFGPGSRTFLLAVDRRNGDTLWQTDEPGGDDGDDKPDGKTLWVGSWSTPIVAQVDGQDQLLVSMPHQVQAYDPASGEVLWRCGGLGDLVYTSVVAGETAGVAMSGYYGPAIGFRLGGSGDVTQTNRLWHHTQKHPQRIGSGVIIGPHVFMANEDGVAQCLELETGNELWQARLSDANIWGSIVAAEGRLYVTNQAGTTFVFAANSEKLEVLAKNDLGEQSNSTLAISDGQIFARTFAHLYCIGDRASDAR